ncbi:MAG TPA: M48 family metallopeptidase [Gemmatimonadaceae bacterium]|nr:M48 family metallopeptidase [Gemmatimonadaceae bacterium]
MTTRGWAREGEWSGVYYDGRTAQREQVTVTLTVAGLALRRPDGHTTLWSYDGVRQTQGRFPGERLRLEFGADPGEALLVDQPGLAEAIRRSIPNANGTLRGPRSTTRFVALGIGLLVAAAALYAWGAPIAADWIAPRVPTEWERAMGQSVLARMAPADSLCGDSRSIAELRAVLDRLVSAGPTLPYDFRVAVVRDPTVNAFAAPGGFIVVNSGLLAAANTPEELAGVLAHEIQHVARRHSTRAMLREVPLRIALSTLSGNSGVEPAARVVGTLGALRYRRDDESEADREGLRLLEAANVDPSGMVTFMRTLQSKGANTPQLVRYLSSHPRTADRVAELEALASRAHPESRPLLDSAEWARLRGVCSTGNASAVR